MNDNGGGKIQRVSSRDLTTEIHDAEVTNVDHQTASGTLYRLTLFFFTILIIKPGIHTKRSDGANKTHLTLGYQSSKPCFWF